MSSDIEMWKKSFRLYEPFDLFYGLCNRRSHPVIGSTTSKNENLREQVKSLEDVSQLTMKIIQFIWLNTNENMAADENDTKYASICNEEDGE
ncbi:hypothetical protein DPMN_009930 [Dreissena polymorpha]|uniref:Uncharacterized protein n=1 Tax=Dreissena polymorpha TaxID=45954 RepID=A0A9D4MXV7_DREPO|nr:hypothetical protein DPMN_009930 [Dreissena polymorpha]